MSNKSSRERKRIVVEFGTPGSHCALLTRQLGIPGISNVTDFTSYVRSEDLLCVDGFRATLTVNPDEQERRAFEKRTSTNLALRAEAMGRCHEPAIAPSEIRVPVMANIANRIDAQVAVQNGADGVGLYRLEALFMLHKNLPTESELLAEITDTLSSLGEKPAMIRLLDVGGDRSLAYFELPIEPAPCLGRRGIRVLLAHPDLLNAQLRALLRLSQNHPIQIMVPMVTIPEDMQAVRRAVEVQAAELGITEIPPLVPLIKEAVRHRPT